MELTHENQAAFHDAIVIAIVPLFGRVVYTEAFGDAYRDWMLALVISDLGVTVTTLVHTEREEGEVTSYGHAKRDAEEWR